MVAALNVVIRSGTLIKDNEIQDTVNDLVLQTYELIRSSDLLAVSGTNVMTDLNVVNSVTSFRVRYQNNPIRGYLEKTTQPFTSCDLNSEYNYQLPPNLGSNLAYPVCLKVDIEKLDTVRYEVTISVRYSTTTNPANLDTYVLTRFGEFIEI